MAEGGLVTQPTLALLGEAGPEVVVPLSNAGLGGKSQQNILYITINIGNVSKEVDLKDVEESTIDGVLKAIDRRL